MLVIENLKKSYDGVEAVKDISFSVAEGDIYGFLGPNGAGNYNNQNDYGYYQAR